MVNFIRHRSIFKIYESIQPFLKYSLNVEEDLHGDKVLVLAPHADDEAIGCGGAITRHTASGKQAHAAIFTMDSAERSVEAKEAARVLGIKDEIFLDYPVESLNNQKGLPNRLAEIFDEVKPDIVFLPFFLDNHTDHRALNAALVSISEKRKYSFLIYAYPVWLPVYPNVIIDIGSVWENKKKAIECYRSQLATRDYVTMSHALSQYWAHVKGHGLELVETFFRATFSEYISLYKKSQP